MKNIEMVMAVTVVVGIVFTAVCQIVRNIRYRELADERTRLLPWLLAAVALTIVCDMSNGGDIGRRMILDLSLGIVSLSVLTSSLWTFGRGFVIMVSVMSVQALLAIYYVLNSLGLPALLTHRTVPVLVSVLTIVMCLIVISGIWLRIRTVRAVMKSGTVWVGMCLCVDVIYLASVVVETVLYIIFDVCLGGFDAVPALVLSFLYAATIASMSFRIISDSAFVLLHRHERRIVESLKVSQIEVSSDSGRDDYLYRDIYDRIVALFESEKPYLNGDLTINDLVKVLYSNKLYISKAISHFTGRNFCQFVNYYRVIYSMELFRANPELKVLELSGQCGFNSMVSYNMAFRLFMGETPSEWCKKEKNRIIKQRK